MGYKFSQDIPLSGLLLDTDNPRFAHTLEGQREAITTMVLDQKDDLVRLGEDILNHGLNPSDLMMVSPSKADKKLLVVHEGNRRFAALKLMSDKHLLHSLHVPDNLKKKFQQLAVKFNANPILTVPCVIYDGYEEARHWIELKHTGKNQGVGTDPWVAFMVNRFKGSSSPGSQALNLVRSQAKLSIPEQQLLDNPGDYESALTRVLGSPAARQMLGVGLTKKKLTPEGDPHETIENLKRLVLAFANRTYNTQDVYTRKGLVKTVGEIVNIGTTGGPQSGKARAGAAQGAAPPPRGPGSRSRDRKTVAPPRMKLYIDVPRVQDIFKELQRLNIYHAPNAAGILIRVFVEQSLDAYALRHKIDFRLKNKNGDIQQGKEVRLVHKVELVTSHLKAAGVPKGDLTEVTNNLKNPNHPMSIETLHAFVHSASNSPKPGDLPIIWNNMTNLIEALWASPA